MGHALHVKWVMSLSHVRSLFFTRGDFMPCPLFTSPYGDVVVSLPDGSTVVSLPDGLAVVGSSTSAIF